MCPLAFYADKEAQTSCTQCPHETPVTKQIGTSDQSKCTIEPGSVCPAGLQCNDVWAPCAAGNYSELGAGSCSTCPSGTYSEERSGFCSFCPPNTRPFQNKKCVPCNYTEVCRPGTDHSALTGLYTNIASTVSPDSSFVTPADWQNDGNIFSNTKIVISSVVCVLLCIVALFGHRFLPEMIIKLDLMSMHNPTKDGEPLIKKRSKFGAAASLALIPLIVALWIALFESNADLLRRSFVPRTPAIGSIMLSISNPLESLCTHWTDNSSSTLKQSGMMVQGLDGVKKEQWCSEGFSYQFKCQSCSVQGEASITVNIPSELQMIDYTIKTAPQFPSQSLEGAVNGRVNESFDFVVQHVTRSHSVGECSYINNMTGASNSWFWIQKTYSRVQGQTWDAAKITAGKGTFWILTIQLNRADMTFMHETYRTQSMLQFITVAVTATGTLLAMWRVLYQHILSDIKNWNCMIKFRSKLCPQSQEEETKNIELEAMPSPAGLITTTTAPTKT